MQHEDPKTVWQNQPAEPLGISIEDVRQRALELEAKTRRELVYGLTLPWLVAGFLGWAVLKVQGGIAQQAALVVAVVWSFAGQLILNRGMWSATQPGTGIDSYRFAIERRRYISARYLLCVFAPVVLAIGTFIAPIIHRGMVMRMIPFLTLVVVWIVGIFVVRARSERKLRNEIAILRRIEKGE